MVYSAQELHHKSITENFASQFPDIIKYIKSIEQKIDETKVQMRNDLLEKNLLKIMTCLKNIPVWKNSSVNAAL